MLFTVLVAVLVIFILFLYFVKHNTLHGLPPGPRGIPLLGNMVQMGKHPHIQLSNWAEKFGKLYTIKLANKTALVINDQKLIRELLGKMVATGKFSSETVLMVTQGKFGIFPTEGDEWLEQKQFFMRAMKNFGFGQGYRMEPLILHECEDLCNWIEEEKRHGNVYLNQKLNQVATNIIWNMVSGERLSSHASPVVHIMDQFFYHLQQVTKSGVIFFSWIRYLAPVRSGYLGFKEAVKNLHNYVENTFEEHKGSRIVDEPVTNVIDAYIEKTENCNDKTSSFYGELGWKHCLNTVAGVLLAGGENTATMINWIVFYLIVFPQVQEKLVEEVDRVIGKNKNPSLADKVKMPYIEAVILESLRLASVVPFGLIHELIESIEFEGYKLPKRLILFPNLYHVHHDQTIWGDPQVFRPERFLESGGDKLKEFVVAFEPGKRSCPGEMLSKDVMFLFLTKLLQKYTFCKDSSVDNEKEYMKPDIGYLLRPGNLPVVMENRNK